MGSGIDIIGSGHLGSLISSGGGWSAILLFSNHDDEDDPLVSESTPGHLGVLVGLVEAPLGCSSLYLRGLAIVQVARENPYLSPKSIPNLQPSDVNPRQNPQETSYMMNYTFSKVQVPLGMLSDGFKVAQSPCLVLPHRGGTCR